MRSEINKKENINKRKNKIRQKTTHKSDDIYAHGCAATRWLLLLNDFALLLWCNTKMVINICLNSSQEFFHLSLYVSNIFRKIRYLPGKYKNK